MQPNYMIPVKNNLCIKIVANQLMNLFFNWTNFYFYFSQSIVKTVNKPKNLELFLSTQIYIIRHIEIWQQVFSESLLYMY